MMKNVMPMRQLMTLFALLVVVAMQGANVGKHVNVSLRHDNIPVEQAQQYFSQWTKTNDRVTFTLVNDETDELGFRHQRYEQQYDGITVDATCLIVHSKDGKLTHVNGFVMETDAAAAQPLAGRTRAAERKDVVLVETPNGYVYAVKSFDVSTSNIVYTDVETGQVVKRLSTIYHFGGQTKMKAQSYYYGEREMDVTRLADGRYILTDSVRKIYTYDAANAPDTVPDKYLNVEICEGYNKITLDSVLVKKYLDEMLMIGQTRRDAFKMQELTSLKLDLSADAREKMGDAPHTLTITTGDVIIEKTVSSDQFPLTIYPDKEETKYFAINRMRLNDTDTTIVILQTENDVIDVLKIRPTAEGGDVASIKANGSKGCLTADASLKACSNYAVDVHWGMQRVYDFYKDVLGRDSYDNAGSMIINVINPSHDDYLNPIISVEEPNAIAAVNNQPRMIYGRGALNQYYDEMVDLSVMGHEFTHLVTWKTANLQIVDEPGAVNEALSDILSVACINHTLNSDGKLSLDDLYTVGRNCGNPNDNGCMRSLKNPWIKQDPKALEGKYWQFSPSIFSDKEVTHTNSNVLGFWFYLLCEGFQPGRDELDDTVVDPEFIQSANTTGWKGIGMDKALKIVYRLQTRYLYEKADYPATFRNSKVAAMDLGYDENSEEYKIMMKCWQAVTPAGWDRYIDIPDAIDFSYTLKTIKTYKENSTELVDYTGTDLMNGIIEMTGTFTVKDAESLSPLKGTMPTNTSAICSIFVSGDNVKNYDFSDTFKDFLGKVLGNPAVAAGYSQSYTKCDTTCARGKASIEVKIPFLKLERDDDIIINEFPRTFHSGGSLTVNQSDTTKIIIYLTTGCPITKALNTDAREKVFFTLYRVDASGQETQINQYYQTADFKYNLFFDNSTPLYYAEEMDYVYPTPARWGLGPQEPLTPGTYHLKVTSTWDALIPATLTITVNGTTGISLIPDDASSGEGVWYTLDGRRLDSQPTSKGIYISKDKKIVIR